MPGILKGRQPDDRKLGAAGPLPGFVYLGEPLPGNRYRIFFVADGFATHIKLAGRPPPTHRLVS